jgi:pilus assembly protein CpaF
MTSIHANSAKEALVKLTTLPLLAGENVSHRFILPTVANSVDLIVHLAADARGRRQVQEVLGIAGRVEAESIESGLIFRRDNGRLVWTGEYPPRRERFEAAGYDLVDVLSR